MTKRLVRPPKLPVRPAAPTAEPVTPKNAMDAGEYMEETSGRGDGSGGSGADTGAGELMRLGAADSSRQSVAVFMCKLPIDEKGRGARLRRVAACASGRDLPRMLRLDLPRLVRHGERCWSAARLLARNWQGTGKELVGRLRAAVSTVALLVLNCRCLWMFWAASGFVVG